MARLFIMIFSLRSISSTIGFALALSGCIHIPTKNGESSQVITEQIPITSDHTSEAAFHPTDQEGLTSIYLDDAENCTVQGDALESLSIPQVITAWDYMSSGFGIDEPTNKQANKKIAKYLRWHKKHPRHLKAVSERGKPYLYFILQELENQNLPLELALIPMVESDFNPAARSPVRAVGLWQVMPKTGKSLGLEQTWWYDGRRDVTRSTQAALTYLKRLHGLFGEDWLLTLAAYNSGQGTVRKAIKFNEKKGLPTDFWSLRLPRETRQYIPKLLALKQIVINPEAHGIALAHIPYSPYFSVVNIESQIDLEQAAKLAGVSTKAIKQLNPGHYRWATSPHGPHELAIPIEHSQQFVTNLGQLPKDKRVSWDQYTIQRGDSLGKIAQRFNTDIQSLKAINNLKKNLIRTGKTLLVPYQGVNSQNITRTAAFTGSTSSLKYRVRKGDSLWTIARQFNTTIKKIAKLNKLRPSKPLQVNQVLVVIEQSAFPNTTSSSTANSQAQTIEYTVKKGDSLARISNRFGVSIKSIEQLNSIHRRNILHPGKILKIQVNSVSVYKNNVKDSAPSLAAS